jgi:hypothetical protein
LCHYKKKKKQQHIPTTTTTTTTSYIPPSSPFPLLFFYSFLHVCLLIVLGNPITQKKHKNTQNKSQQTNNEWVAIGSKNLKLGGPQCPITFMEISYGALSGNHPEEEVKTN